MSHRREYADHTTTEAAVKRRPPKRYLWLISIIAPTALGTFGPLGFMLVQDVWVLWLPLVLSNAVLPVLDLYLGEDNDNVSEDDVPALEADLFYRYILYALVPVLWFCYVFAVWFVAKYDLPWYAALPVVLSVSITAGFGVILGHELGHKPSRHERWLAKIILALTGYGHFYVEHNRGHHRDVATPEDPASSRMGENIYRFVVREMPGAARRAWILEKNRLERRNQSPWSLSNEVLQPLLITLAFYGLLTAFLGAHVMPFVLLTAFLGNFQLTSANYIEHYGLLRKIMPDGLRERCQPHHSWNSNHQVSNLAILHLQRHSDHHANPARRYQSLRNFDNLPRLPNGYFAMYVIAYIPPLWFRIMDARLLAAVDYDPDRINFDPRERANLIAKYKLRSSPVPVDISESPRQL